MASANSNSCNSNPNPTPIGGSDPPPVAGVQFPDNFELIFTLDLSDDSPDLASDQVRIAEPAKMWDNYLSLHPDGYYAERFDTPGKVFFVFRIRDAQGQELLQGPPADHLLFACAAPTIRPITRRRTASCFGAKRAIIPALRLARTITEGSLRCHRRVRDWTRPRSPEAAAPRQALPASFSPRRWRRRTTAFGAFPRFHSLLARRAANELRDGFTVFTIKSAAKLGVDADAVALDLTVNDTPVLVEGLPAELQPRHFDPDHPSRSNLACKISISKAATQDATGLPVVSLSTRPASRSALRSRSNYRMRRFAMWNGAPSRRIWERSRGRLATMFQIRQTSAPIGGCS